MDRRESLKALALGSVSTGILLDACKTVDKKVNAPAATPEFTMDRAPEEIEHYRKVMAEKFLTDHEMQTVTILCDIIIPADDKSGSASEAKVPEFIEFIMKDMPEHQTPMRGGLLWLDVQSNKQFQKPFTDCTTQQRIILVDQIAYPAKAKPEMKQGVAFFNMMRDLTASGFYTTAMGIKDIGYVGNVPNQWNGVPDDVLKQYSVAYTDKELKECVSFNNPA